MLPMLLIIHKAYFMGGNAQYMWFAGKDCRARVIPLTKYGVHKNTYFVFVLKFGPVIHRSYYDNSMSYPGN